MRGLVHSTTASVTRHSHRRRVRSREPNAHRRIAPDWDVSLGGRIMTAACDVPSHSTLASEVPVLRGRAHALGCPGCSDEPCAGRFGCVWESHVKRAPRLANAALWHKELCSKLDEITDPQDRTNHVRVVCLLAMVTQACASEPLFEWLLANLRPMSDECSHPLHQSTASFGARFARAIPPPPHGNDASDPKMWADRLSALLIRCAH